MPGRPADDTAASLLRRVARTLSAVLLAGVAVSSACYRPQRADCVVACGAEGGCPEGMWCSRGLCVRSGGSCEAETGASPCQAGEARCADGERVLACDPQAAAFREARRCAGEEPSCVDGECRRCAPGTTRCADATSLALCNATGSSETRLACPEHLPLCTLGECSEALQVAVGGAHACARTANGLLRCWGDNSHGQLGLLDRRSRGTEPELGRAAPTEFEPVVLLAGRTAERVAAGGGHTCALLDDGTLRCWGLNGSGQLGVGDSANRGDSPQRGEAPLVDLGAGRVAVGLALGTRHSCALLQGGRVKCWGNNAFGQLGLGDTKPRGGAAADMGDALPEVSLGSRAFAIQLATGGHFTCALLHDGRVKCWGNNELGQLGTSETDDRGTAAGQMGDALQPVVLRTPGSARAISAGYAHACALLVDGSVECWGSREGGRAGTDRPRAPFEPGGESVLAVAAGGAHTCALRADRRVTCWGENFPGALGVGDRSNRHAGEALLVDLGTRDGAPVPASALRAGIAFSCAVLSGGEVKCWGSNERGQLGLFDSENRGDDSDEMGDNLRSVPLDP